MQRTIRVIVRQCIPVLLALVVAEPARAQIFETVGIRAQGMGGAFVAVADDATASWWNPAGLANGSYLSAIFESGFRSDLSGSSARGFAVAYPALGLSYYRVSLAGIRAVPPAGQASANREDERGLSVFGASVGQSIGDHLVIASTLKVVHAFEETKGDLDLGAMVALGPMRVGLSWKNVTRPEFSDGSEPLILTRQARAGIAFRSGPVGRPDVTLAIDADLMRTPTPVGDARHLAAGTEVWALGRRIGLRTGVDVDTVEGHVSGSLGASVALRPGFYADAQGTRGGDDIRNGWGLGLRLTF